MQSAYDRDEYVTIQWENIQSGTENNFEKYSNYEVTHYNTTYDYYSVMHYNAYGFSKNGNPTIVPIVSLFLCNSKGFNFLINFSILHNSSERMKNIWV